MPFRVLECFSITLPLLFMTCLFNVVLCFIKQKALWNFYFECSINEGIIIFLLLCLSPDQPHSHCFLLHIRAWNIAYRPIHTKTNKTNVQDLKKAFVLNVSIVALGPFSTTSQRARLTCHQVKRSVTRSHVCADAGLTFTL